jgi:hypothetical protein
MSASPYRLDELGWLQFERLCVRVLEAESGLTELRWSGSADRWRTAQCDRAVLLPGALTLEPPVTCAAVWLRPGEHGQLDQVRALTALTYRIQAAFDTEIAPGGRLLLLTNVAENAVRRALGALQSELCDRTVVLCAEDIAASLDRHAAIRVAVPSILGLRDLAPLIDPTQRARSTLEIETAQELARVFWPTRAYAAACATLERHRFAVLTGPPEMGKTAIARMLALAKMTDGWEAYECTHPDQMRAALDDDRSQLFVADDAFGSTEYRADAAERWASALGSLLPRLDDRHWLIWTSRPAPLRAGVRRVRRERGSERFPSPGEVLVDASALDLAEKTLILFRHAKSGHVDREARRLLRIAASAIVEHPHFTPERVRRFVTGWLPQTRVLGHRGGERELVAMVEAEFASPTDAMRASFRALGQEHRELLIAFLDAPAGLIDERELTATLRRHYAGGLSRPPGELIDRLTDHFLRVTPLGIAWVHPSWRDLLIEQLSASAAARRRFLQACGVDGVMLALSTGGGVAGDRSLPLLVDDADWDALGDRLRVLVPELDDPDTTRVLLSLLAAVRTPRGIRELPEVFALAEYVLGATRRLWDREQRPLPLSLIEAWYRLSARLPAELESPDPVPTWTELHPGTAPFAGWERRELARADDWLAFAQALAAHDPSALGRLDFPERDEQMLSQLIGHLGQPLPDDLSPLVQSILARIEELSPAQALRAHDTADALQWATADERARWWAPEDIATPPSYEPLTSASAGFTRADFTRADVARVLRDL